MDTARVYFHDTCVLEFGLQDAWFLPCILSKIINCNRNFLVFSFSNTPTTEHPIYPSHCSLCLIHLLVPWTISYGYSIFITHKTFVPSGFDVDTKSGVYSFMEGIINGTSLKVLNANEFAFQTSLLPWKKAMWWFIG